MDKAQQDALKKAAGIEAAKLIQNGMIAGLGTGSTAYHMVNAVGEMVKNGLKIQAIPTSKATEAQAPEPVPPHPGAGRRLRHQDRQHR